MKTHWNTASKGAFIALLLFCGCASDLNFDEITPECSAPSFDATRRAEFCTGEARIKSEITPLDDQLFIGADVRGDKTLLVSGHRFAEVSGATFFDRLTMHTFDSDKASGQLSIDGTTPHNAGATFFGSPIVTPLTSRLLSERGGFSAVIFSGVSFFSHVDKGQDAALELPVLRLPRGGAFFGDIDALETEEGRLLVFIAAANAGLKPLAFDFDEDTATWIEDLPIFDDRLDLDDLACPLTCNVFGDFQGLCVEQCPECRTIGVGCSRCRAQHCISYPMELGAYSLDVDEPNERVYVGSVGAAFSYDAARLDPANNGNITTEEDALGVYVEPRVDRYELPDLTGEGGLMLVIDIQVHDNRAYMIAIPAETFEGLEDDQRVAFLVIVELNEGRFGETLFTMELPKTAPSTLFYETLPLGNDLLAIKIVESRLEEANIGDDDGPSDLLTQDDVHLFVLDLVSLFNPQFVLEERFPNNGEHGLIGLGGLKGGSSFIMPSPAGALSYDVTVSGDAL